MQTALVTGASSGIGRHLAREFAQRRRLLVAIAAPQAGPRCAAAPLRTPLGVQAHALAELQRTGAPRRVDERREAESGDREDHHARR